MECGGRRKGHVFGGFALAGRGQQFLGHGCGVDASVGARGGCGLDPPRARTVGTQSRSRAFWGAWWAHGPRGECIGRNSPHSSRLASGAFGRAQRRGMDRGGLGRAQRHPRAPATLQGQALGLAGDPRRQVGGPPCFGWVQRMACRGSKTLASHVAQHATRGACGRALGGGRPTGIVDVGTSRSFARRVGIEHASLGIFGRCRHGSGRSGLEGCGVWRRRMCPCMVSGTRHASRAPGASECRCPRVVDVARRPRRPLHPLEPP